VDGVSYPRTRRRLHLALTGLAFGLLVGSWAVWQRGQAGLEERLARFEANLIGGWDVYDSFTWTAIANRFMLPFNAVSTALDVLGAAALASAWGARRVRSGWRIAGGTPFVLSTAFHGLCLFVNIVFGP
jgi:hypothetical protein